MKIHSQAPSTRRITLPAHEHAARRARTKILGLPRNQKPTPPARQPAFVTHPRSLPDLGTCD